MNGPKSSTLDGVSSRRAVMLIAFVASGALLPACADSSTNFADLMPVYNAGFAAGTPLHDRLSDDGERASRCDKFLKDRYGSDAGGSDGVGPDKSVIFWHGCMAAAVGGKKADTSEDLAQIINE